ncbi:MAG TPA: cysteine desulfurase family protein [Dehalococcoidia bacterium]|nr:cysteine desulfurase family protein [Dehalococcoidia bacterium]
MIYLDNAATTPLHPRALEAMMPYLTESFGNPSATYALARKASKAIDDARRTVAAVLNARPSDIVFTSGGTESINTALKGVAFAQKKARAGNHVVTTTVEHHAVHHSCNYLEQFGFEVTYVPVDSYGCVDPDDVARAVTERTVLVSVMLANNEVGTIEPIPEIAAAVGERGRALRKRIPLHTDAVQAPGALELDVDRLGVDLLSLSGHKFGGPKGTGILYLRRGTPFVSQMSGGGQERQRRAGTENVAGIVGQAVALEAAESEREAHSRDVAALRDFLIESVLRSVPDSRLNGCPDERLPNNVNISFRGVRGDELVLALDKKGIAASAGAACGSSTWEPSHVLLAMGASMPEAVGALRLTLSAATTRAEVEAVAAVLPGLVASLREGLTARAV